MEKVINVVTGILSLIVGIISLIFTFYIAKSQRKREEQNDKLREDLNNLKEDRHKDIIKQNALKFIQEQTKEELNYFPLAVIARAYNDIFPYRRKIYRDFCILTDEEAEKVCSILNCNFINTKIDSDKLLEEFLDKLQSDSIYDDNLNFYYENFKYVYKALDIHEDYRLFNIYDKVKNKQYIDDIISKIIDNKDKIQNKNLHKIFVDNNYISIYTVCEFARKFSRQFYEDFAEDELYLGYYTGKYYDTFEDLFLCVLYTIYHGIDYKIKKEKLLKYTNRSEEE